MTIKIGSLLAVLLGLTGCQTLTPIAEASHTSHATQHVGPNRTNYGWNTVGLGVRFKRGGLTVDMVESYSVEPVDGMHEVFQGRLVYEFNKQGR